jgi:hypothetical protein
MAILITYFDTGFGVTNGGAGVYRINGHGFAPTPDPSGGQSWNLWTEPIVGNAGIYNQTDTFDLTGFGWGLEVIAALANFRTTLESDFVSATMSIKDFTGTTVLTGTLYYDMHSWDEFDQGCISWIGYVGAGHEIWGNGRYTVKILFYSYTEGLQYGPFETVFWVTNYSYLDEVISGYIWIEGENLCYTGKVSVQSGTFSESKVVCMHDGSTYGFVGVDKAGAMWLEDVGRITYIDSEGYKRRTKMGDKYGSPQYVGEIPSTPGVQYAGTIYVNTEGYISIISSDGIKYRIGAGYIYSGDYQ